MLKPSLQPVKMEWICLLDPAFWYQSLDNELTESKAETDPGSVSTQVQPWVHMRASYLHPRGMNHYPPQTVKEIQAVSCLARASMSVGDAQETEGSGMSQTQPTKEPE